jgi:D-arabinose 1-dehydrogenase-like Zn-dependent alcohol dehydrogenase
MNATYKAIKLSGPGKFSEVRKPLLDPGPHQVHIRVKACGVCHSDSATVEGLFPIEWPRVPGHEVVGSIDALGSGVQGWAVGQRAGVGFLGGFCGYCEFCRNGDLVNCRNQEYTGIHHDGGYAEVMIAKASGLVAIPDDLSSADAAPLLCAGITTFSALRNSPARAGDVLFIESMPYGGVGTSGIGNYYGKYGYDSLTHAKSVLISPPDVAIDHLFPPYTKEKVQALDQWFEY